MSSAVGVHGRELWTDSLPAPEAPAGGVLRAEDVLSTADAPGDLGPRRRRTPASSVRSPQLRLLTTKQSSSSDEHRPASWASLARLSFQSASSRRACSSSETTVNGLTDGDIDGDAACGVGGSHGAGSSAGSSECRVGISTGVRPSSPSADGVGLAAASDSLSADGGATGSNGGGWPSAPLSPRAAWLACAGLRRSRQKACPRLSPSSRAQEGCSRLLTEALVVLGFTAGTGSRPPRIRWLPPPPPRSGVAAVDRAVAAEDRAPPPPRSGVAAVDRAVAAEDRAPPLLSLAMSGHLAMAGRRAQPPVRAQPSPVPLLIY